MRDPVVHAKHKKSVLPGFSTRALREQESTVHQYLDLLFRQVDKIGAGGQKAVDAAHVYAWFTFDIIGDLAFGESFNALEEASETWVSPVQDALRYSGVQYMRKNQPLLAWFVVPLLFPKELAEMHQAYLKLAHEKARKRIDIGSSLGRQDFFGHLLKNQKITEEEIMADSFTFIMAGSETTATVLTGITFFLLKNPETMRKLVKEVRETFTSQDMIKSDSTARLKYLNAVIEEGLRMFPPLAIELPRECPGTMVDGHYIPKGVSVSANTYFVARDPRHWSDAESFRPERWIGEGFGDDMSVSHPFSIGPRSCLGINLAWLEMRVTLARTVFLYDMELVSQEIEDWNRACRCYAFWTLPKLLVKFHPKSS